MSAIKISKLIRSRRRSIALVVTPDAELLVRAPLHTPLSFIEQLVQKKSDWIIRRVAQVQSRPRPVERKFADGETFLFLGQPFKLRMYDGGRIALDEELLFPVSFLGREEEELTFWYKQKALQLITERVTYYGQLMGLHPQSVRLSDAIRRWGACGPTDALSFSWRLIMAPLAVVDYVAVHELAHLAVRNHSARFWSKVKLYCPQYKDCRAWLRHNEHLIVSN